MNIVINLEPFLKQLNEINNLFDLIHLCREISKISSLQIKKKLLELKCELYAESMLGPRWQREKPDTGIKLPCVKCGEMVSLEDIKRNGHYQKGLNFDEGYTKIRMPLLVHKDRDCLGVIQVSWPYLEKRKRFWFDVIFNVIGYYFEGIGPRGIQRIFKVRLLATKKAGGRKLTSFMKEESIMQTDYGWQSATEAPRSLMLS